MIELAVDTQFCNECHRRRSHPWHASYVAAAATAQQASFLRRQGLNRLTLHHFIIPNIVINNTTPFNSDVRISNSDEWPPALLFDAAYRCAALKSWGVPAFINCAKIETNDIYYPLKKKVMVWWWWWWW